MPSEVTPARRGWSAGRPVGKLAVDVERTALKLDVRIELFEVQAGGNLRVLERQHGLDEAGDACRRVQVAHVGLERADAAVAAARPAICGRLA